MKKVNNIMFVVVAALYALAGVAKGGEVESILTMNGLPRALLEHDVSDDFTNRKLLGTGTQTIYGSVGGKGWCGKTLKGGSAVPVALGPKYIFGTSPHNKNCGKCVCVTIVGVDTQRNPHPPSYAKKYFGKKFKGICLDQCPECKGDHIDVLSDQPYVSKTMTKSVAYGVGTWKVSWKFISCGAKC